MYKNCNRKYPETSVVVKYKKKRICITTKGDSLKIVQDEINEFKKNGYDAYNCDLFVCASHNSGKLVRHLLEKFDKIVFIAKEDVQINRDVFCKRKAEMLFNEIDKLL